MKTIVLFKTLSLILMSLLIGISLYSQDNYERKDSILLKGVVIVENGDSIPGVSIIEKGTTNGAITDVTGKFQLKVSKGAKIVISYVGMKSIEFESLELSNFHLRFNLSNGLIEFCCSNHKPSHCATTINEMQELSQKNNCKFK